MILSTGTTFGPYKIVAPLGHGGMGEVYRARDGRLGRDVALKVLREEDAEDPELLTRFEREARAASSLNHPNIVVVYEAGTASVPGRETPVHYLAMELIDGEPIAASLAGEPMPLRRFLDLATQLADGIARAHESGIVHRDLKPSNVFVTPEGRVKILDFGLATLRQHPGDDTQSPTAAGRLTSPGMAVGTLGYMSPEQARGETPTPASDQFSLGCIFYEMLTGQQAFGRSSAAEAFSAILRDDPRPVDEINPLVPQPLRWILERCLAKAPRDRYASTRDLARDLQTLRDHSATTSFRAAGVAGTAPRRRSGWLIAAAAIALAAAAAGGILLLDRFRAPLPPEFRRLTFREGIVTRALFAPNGSILYAASWEGNPVRSYLALPESTGIDRALDSDVQFPLAYSEDGSQVLVLVGPSRLSANESGTLAWWPSLGGKPRRILDNAGWADVAGNGRFLAVVRDLGAERVLEIRSAEGALQRTLFRTSGVIWFARISPDDKNVAFVHFHSGSTAPARFKSRRSTAPERRS